MSFLSKSFILSRKSSCSVERISSEIERSFFGTRHFDSKAPFLVKKMSFELETFSFLKSSFWVQKFHVQLKRISFLLKKSSSWKLYFWVKKFHVQLKIISFEMKKYSHCTSFICNSNVPCSVKKHLFWVQIFSFNLQCSMLTWKWSFLSWK